MTVVGAVAGQQVGPGDTLFLVQAEPDPAAAGEDAVTAFAATAGTTYLLTPRPAASGS